MVDATQNSILVNPVDFAIKSFIVNIDGAMLPYNLMKQR